jgi:hypothetical protein
MNTCCVPPMELPSSYLHSKYPGKPFHVTMLVAKKQYHHSRHLDGLEVQLPELHGDGDGNGDGNGNHGSGRRRLIWYRPAAGHPCLSVQSARLAEEYLDSIALHTYVPRDLEATRSCRDAGRWRRYWG